MPYLVEPKQPATAEESAAPADVPADATAELHPTTQSAIRQWHNGKSAKEQARFRISSHAASAALGRKFGSTEQTPTQKQLLADLQRFDAGEFDRESADDDPEMLVTPGSKPDIEEGQHPITAAFESALASASKG